MTQAFASQSEKKTREPTKAAANLIIMSEIVTITVLKKLAKQTKNRKKNQNDKENVDMKEK